MAETDNSVPEYKILENSIEKGFNELENLLAKGISPESLEAIIKLGSIATIVTKHCHLTNYSRRGEYWGRMEDILSNSYKKI